MSDKLLAEVAEAERALAQAYRDEAEHCRLRGEAEQRIMACLKARNKVRQKLDEHIKGLAA